MIQYRCPTCGMVFEVERREDAKTRPFCSDRCQQVDLGKWLDGTYRTSESLDPGVFDEEGLAGPPDGTFTS